MQNLDMKKFFLLIFSMFIVAVISGQITEEKKIVDSISANNWKKQIPDLDSLAEVSLIKLAAKKKDTIIFFPRSTAVETTIDVPLTPFQLINTPQEKNWFFFGQNNMIFNQSSFNNWNSGGNNNIGGIIKLNYNLSFKKGKHFLENSILSGYGLVATDGQSTRKTDDYVNIQSNYGYDLGKNYYLSAGFQFLTQFAPGYNYGKTPEPNFSDRISKFMAPAYFNLGVGISYNPKENFQVIVRPINGKFTIVADAQLQKKGLYGLEEDGQTIRKELGAMVNVLYRFKVYKDISFTNSLNFFANYLYHTERVDVAYNTLINFRLNRFVSTSITADLMYDHDQVKKLQIKQTLGIGLTYNLGFEYKDKPKNKTLKPFVN